MRCDILLVHYKYDPISYCIRKATKCHWNHVALIIDDKHIAEAKPTGIKKNKITEYSNNFLYETKVIGIIGLSEEERDKIIELAEIEIGDRYSYFAYIHNLYLNYKNKPTAHVNCCSFVALCFAVVNRDFRKDKSITKTTPNDIEKYVKEINNEIKS